MASLLSPREQANLGRPAPPGISQKWWAGYQNDLKRQMSGKNAGGGGGINWGDVGASLPWRGAAQVGGAAVGGSLGSSIGPAGLIAGAKIGMKAAKGQSPLPKGKKKASSSGGGGGGGGGTDPNKAANDLIKQAISMGYSPQQAQQFATKFLAEQQNPGFSQFLQQQGPNPMATQLLYSTTIGPQLQKMEQQSQGIEGQLGKQLQASATDPNIPANDRGVLAAYAPMMASMMQQAPLASAESTFGNAPLDVILNAIQSEQQAQQQTLAQQQRLSGLASQQDLIALQNQMGISGSGGSSGQVTIDPKTGQAKIG